METAEPSGSLPVLTAEQRCEIIENSELESPTGQLSSELCCELLALYLLQNDTNNMKYLWKRIPDGTKLKCPEALAIWEVGKVLWKRNYSEAHTLSRAYSWSDTINKLMQIFRESLRTRCTSLVANGYSSIRKQDLAALLGLNEQETSELITNKGWITTADSEFVKPVPEKRHYDNAIDNKQYLEKLTQYILFLET